ncbi:endonuclease/exonuclease/phosphatase family protein [Serinicoccus kebangsaanensis]|uniref:endonuclease/exonuclease/phosphatase family protein n=1 Tax=Serinicoccus kebangsaanensis TaxID=2602069 RepID=UPI00124F5D8D|nr:endonuclease/exonuclease/phosphatase family protein [Serinicoccus kebangsaanensis]
MPSLRVATYNLRGLKDDAGAAAEVVRAIAPDVLLLQEVPRYPTSEYAISAFARSCDLLWSGRTRMVSGTGLMTALRVTAADSQDRRLAVGLRENPRSYTVTQVRLPEGQRADVVSIHLSLRAEQRVEHARTVLTELAADPRFGEDVPLVVGGDLNEGRDGAAWGAIGEALVEVSADRPTFPAHRPHRYIDAIFARGHTAATPGDPALLDGMPVARASDHLPVWVDLEV